MIRLVFTFFLITSTTLNANSLYREIDLSDGGTIQGKVLWKSAPPVPQIVPVTKDQET
jgi:hypothetical protein